MQSKIFKFKLIKSSFKQVDCLQPKIEKGPAIDLLLRPISFRRTPDWTTFPPTT